MKGTITVTLELTAGGKTMIDWRGGKNAEFTSAQEVDQFEKALIGLRNNLDKIQGVPDPRCRNCKHWGRGKASISAYHLSYVCFKMRKEIKHHKDQVVFYARPGLSQSCDMFEQREKGEKIVTYNF